MTQLLQENDILGAAGKHVPSACNAKTKFHLKNLFKNETGTALESERLIETVGTMDYYKLLQVDWCTDKSQCGK